MYIDIEKFFCVFYSSLKFYIFGYDIVEMLLYLLVRRYENFVFGFDFV